MGTDRTRGIDGANGITVGLLHTGQDYADELSTDGVLYHYPRTGRPPGRDRSEVEATKAAGRLRLPVFVVTPGDPSSSRNVHKGWIEGWVDDAEVFLVTFAEDPPPEPPSDEGESPFVLDTEITRSSRSVVSRPNQQRFKFAVLKLYGPACAVCDWRLQTFCKPRIFEGRRNEDQTILVTDLCCVHCTTDMRVLPNGPDAVQPRLTRGSLHHLPPNAASRGSDPCVVDLGKVLDHLHAMQFGLLRFPRSGADAQHIDLHRVTVVDRWIPLETAAYGTRVARPARTTMPASGSDGSQLDQRVRSVLGDRLVAKNPQGAWQREWGDSNSTTPVSPTPGQGSVGGRPADSPNVRCPLLPAVVRRLPVGCGPSTDRGVRFRLVADASGAPVLRDQAADRPGGTAGPITLPVARREL